MASRLPITSAAPAFAIARAVALPMPVPPPVTTPTLPFKSAMYILISNLLMKLFTNQTVTEHRAVARKAESRLRCGKFANGVGKFSAQVLYACVLLGVLQPSIAIECFVCLGYGGLIGQHHDADIAEDGTQMDQTAKPTKVAGRGTHQNGGLPFERQRDGSLGTGRDTQSMAFFKTAVIELLYSGEAIRKPSCSTINAFSFAAASGIPASRSKSSSNSGIGMSLRSTSVTSAPHSSAALAAIRTSFLLYESFRVLPAKAKMRGFLS